MIWQGIVVAEPQPSMYLLQIDKLDIGAENVQVLAPLLEMLGETEDDGFRFYDTEDEARSAYAQWIATEGSRT